MSVEQWILLIGAIAGLSSALFVGYNGLSSARAGQAATRESINARIDERMERDNERTHRDNERLELKVDELQKSLEDAHRKIRGQGEEIAAVKKDRAALESIVAKLVARNNEIIDHVIVLENGYPDPPGPPPRPWSNIPDIHL